MKVRVQFEDIRITKRWALKDQSVRIGAGLILFRISFTGFVTAAMNLWVP